MKRREFLKAAGAASAWPGAASAQRPSPAASDRDAWIAIMRRLADPVLTHLANGTLKARMPVEQAPGADRRSVTHLEALGRLVAGLAPWIELPSDDTAEGRLRADYAQLARRAIARAVDPASPDFLNFTRDRQPLVDAAFLAQGLLRAPRALRDGLDPADRRRLIAALESTRPITPPFNNWLLFSAMVEAGLKALGAELGSRARRLRAAPARAVVQGRRRLRRRPGVPLGLLQQLRDPSDAGGRPRRVRGRVAGVDGHRGPRRERAPGVTRRSRSGSSRRTAASRRSAGRSRTAAAPFTCSRSRRSAAACPTACRPRRCAAR